ncbi:MAG: 4Fe-4S dicluster domain-containing protein [Calditrichaeota bacterium]|nr:4Fe-4S dicluster domain-containing protein [Calditrichota bacterium]
MCKGCEICVEVCPKAALKMIVTPDRWEGAMVEVVDIMACNACMLCEHQCPDFAIEVYSLKKEAKAKEKKAVV